MERFREFEREAFRVLEHLLRQKASGILGEKVEVLIDVTATLFDYDLWVLGKIKEYGLGGFMKKLENYKDVVTEMVSHLLQAHHAYFITLYGVLSSRENYKLENLNKAVSLAWKHCQELDDYVDTVNILITPNLYEEVKPHIEK